MEACRVGRDRGGSATVVDRRDGRARARPVKGRRRQATLGRAGVLLNCSGRRASLDSAVASRSMAEPLQTNHREPLRRTRPARSRWCCRTAAACRCHPTPRGRRSSRASWRGVEGARLAGARARSRAPTSTTTSTSPAAPGAMLAIAEAMVGRRRARPRSARATGGAVLAPAPRQPREHPASLRRLERVLPAVARPRGWCTRAPISATTTTRSTTRRRGSSTTSAASCGLAPGERFLDIGCGWGGLDLLGGASTTASTPPASRCRSNQFDHVTRARSPRAGLHEPRARAACATISTCPRTCTYDKVASVGMFEHVGTRTLPQLLRQDLSRC